MVRGVVVQLVARREGGDVGVSVAAAAGAHAHAHGVHALARAALRLAAHLQFLHAHAHAQTERGTPLHNKEKSKVASRNTIFNSS